MLRIIRNYLRKCYKNHLIKKLDGRHLELKQMIEEDFKSLTK